MQNKDLTNFKNKFDSVVMFTWSNWFTEMRSNRYHYATRFSKLVPVFFIQESPEIKGIKLTEAKENLFIFETEPLLYNTNPSLIAHELSKLCVIKPLYWVYNINYINLLKDLKPATTIYHATEDYLCDDFQAPPKKFLENLFATMNFSDLIITVSKGIKQSILKSKKVLSPIEVITNGCDVSFWRNKTTTDKKNRVIYQGGIHRKLDLELLDYITNINQELDFHFCGEAYFPECANNQDAWNTICKRTNVTYHGKLSAEDVRDLCHSCNTGIIPFVQNDWIIKRSFPLKSFEYIASKLNVVTVPIDSLLEHKEIFNFATTKEQFSDILKTVSSQNFKTTSITEKALLESDYDLKFLSAIEKINKIKSTNISFKKKNILVLYDISSCHVTAISDHLRAFELFSTHRVSYLHISNQTLQIETEIFEVFDVVCIHYSLRICFKEHYPKWFYDKLNSFKGLKIVFAQDEYDKVNNSIDFLQKANIDVLFTCVPDDQQERVYPKDKLPNLKCIQNLTGYVPYNISYKETLKIKDRPVDVCYRGRDLSLRYGTLGLEKKHIGEDFLKALSQDSISLITDISSNSSDRVYGDQWPVFLSSSKVMLGTESGSNLFDFDGNLEEELKDHLNDGMTEKEILDQVIHPKEKGFHINQISPKFFESISLKTGLVLFEGSYSEILVPNVHYIPLKKDFSNIKEVSEKINDHAFLQNMVDKAYQDIIMSNEYQYSTFINNSFDFVVDNFSLYTKDSVLSISTVEKPEKLPSNKIQTRVSPPDKIIVRHMHPFRHKILETTTFVTKYISSKIETLLGLEEHTIYNLPRNLYRKIKG